MSDDEDDPEKLKAIYEGSREVENSNELDGVPKKGDEPGDALDLPGFRFLTSLLKATPFSDFLHYKAMTVNTHKTRQGRITKYCDDHPRIAGFCTLADLALRIVVVVMVLAAITAILAGTILRTFYL